MIISFGYVILLGIVMGAYLFIPLMVVLTKLDMSSDKATQAANQLLYLHENFWPVLLLSLLAIGCHSIFTSHKIAGPLYRFNLIFKALKEGTVPTPVQLRRGDYLHDEKETINQMLESLREKLTAIKEEQASLHKSILQCKDLGSHPSMDELTKRVEEFYDKEKKLGEKLGYFKVMA